MANNANLAEIPTRDRTPKIKMLGSSSLPSRPSLSSSASAARPNEYNLKLTARERADDKIILFHPSSEACNKPCKLPMFFRRKSQG